MNKIKIMCVALFLLTLSSQSHNTQLQIVDFRLLFNVDDYSIGLNESIHSFNYKSKFLAQKYRKFFRVLTGGFHSAEFILEDVEELINYTADLEFKTEYLLIAEYLSYEYHISANRIDSIIVRNKKYNSQLMLVADPLLDNPISTQRGIKIGTSKTQIINEYGQPHSLEEKNSKNIILNYFLDDPTPFSERYVLTFMLNNDEVIMITLNNIYKNEYKRNLSDFSFYIHDNILRIGDHFNKAENIFGAINNPKDIVNIDKYNNKAIFNEAGVTVSYKIRKKDMISQITVDSEKIKTSKGLSIGGLKNSVIAKYGDDYFSRDDYIYYGLTHKDDPSLDDDPYHFTIYYLYFYFDENDLIKRIMMEVL